MQDSDDTTYYFAPPRASFSVIAWRIFSLLSIFLFTGAVIGIAIYVSAAFIMPLILSQLSPVALTLGLAAGSQAFILGLVGLISILPLLFTVMAGVKWLRQHREIFTRGNRDLVLTHDSDSVLKNIKDWLSNPYFKGLVINYIAWLLLVSYGTYDHRNYSHQDYQQGKGAGAMIHNIAAGLSALGVGIALCFPIAALAPAMTALGMASGVVVLSQMFLAIAAMFMIYELLVLPIKLNNLKVFLKNKSIDPRKRIAYGVGLAVLIIAMAIISSVFFLPLLQMLTPVVGSASMAGFLALVTSFAVLMLMVRTAKMFTDGLGIVGEKLFKGKSGKPESFDFELKTSDPTSSNTLEQTPFYVVPPQNGPGQQTNQAPTPIAAPRS